MNKYFYFSSLKLLNLINKKLGTNNLVDFNPETLPKEIMDVDHTWTLISTSLLMSEHLNDTDKLYATLDEHSLETIKDLLQSTSMVMPGEAKISECCLLDSQNKTASSFKEFIPLPKTIEEEEQYEVTDNKTVAPSLRKMPQLSI